MADARSPRGRHDPEALARAGALLSERGFPALPLSIAPDGEDNLVVLAPEHVVRLRCVDGDDHRHEARAVKQARSLGVHAADCVTAGESWSIWERLPGNNLWRSPNVVHRFWGSLHRDLTRLHSLPAPVDTEMPDLVSWQALAPELDVLSESELITIDRVVQEMPRKVRLTYAHGDVHGGNIIVDPEGGYGGLIDWSNAGWWPPERDYAILEMSGLRFALDAPMEPLDWHLVASIRVGEAVRFVSAGSRPVALLREALGFWELMR